MNKNLEKKIQRILYGILIFMFLIPVLLPVYFFLKDQITIERLEKNLYIEEVYKEIGKYRIGKQSSGPVFGGDTSSRNTICDFYSNKCLGGKLLGTRIVGEHIYIYMALQFANMDVSSIRGTDYPMLYSIWGGEHINTPEKIEDIKQFGIFTQNSQDFYSLNELEDLPEQQQKILLDLRDNPRFSFE